MKLSIIIPVYNEAATLHALLQAVVAIDLKKLKKEIIVIDNNSTDGSYDIAQRWAAMRSHTACDFRIDKEMRQGKGFAVRRGFELATGDIFLIQDADLEYDVKDYPRLLQPILDGQTHFVLGSRHLGKADWKIRQFQRAPLRSFCFNMGGVFFHALFNLLYGVRLSDPTTMYKVFRRECIQGLKFSAQRFDFDYELLGKILRAGHQPIEVPVTYHSRGFSEGKKDPNLFRSLDLGLGNRQIPFFQYLEGSRRVAK